jgi:hypothetical protein
MLPSCTYPLSILLRAYKVPYNGMQNIWSLYAIYFSYLPISKYNGHKYETPLFFQLFFPFNVSSSDIPLCSLLYLCA